jgi:hypothetical protein
MDDLARSNGSQIAITLVGKNDPVGKNPLKAGCHRRRTAVGCDAAIEIKVLISEYCTTYRRHTDSALANVEFIDDFGDQPVNCTVATAWTIMGVYFGQTVWKLINRNHFIGGHVGGKDTGIGFHQ